MLLSSELEYSFSINSQETVLVLGSAKAFAAALVFSSELASNNLVIEPHKIYSISL